MSDTNSTNSTDGYTEEVTLFPKFEASGYSSGLPDPVADVPEPKYAVSPAYSPVFWDEDKRYRKSYHRGLNFKFEEDHDMFNDYIEWLQANHEYLRVEAFAHAGHPRRGGIVTVGVDGDDGLVKTVYSNGLDMQEITDFKRDELAIFEGRMRISANYTYYAVGQTESHAKSIKQMAEQSVESPDMFLDYAETVGIPECCAEFYTHVYQAQQVTAPIYEAACNSPSAKEVHRDFAPFDGDDHIDNEHRVRVTDPEVALNMMWAGNRIQFVYHFPCSLECEASVDHADNLFAVLQEQGKDAETVEFVKEFMDEPVSFETGDCQARINNKYLIGHHAHESYFDNKVVEFIDEHEKTSHGKDPV